MDLTIIGYEFTNPSPLELEARRDALNKVGYTAYLAAIALLFATKAFRIIASFTTSTSRQRQRPNFATRWFRQVAWVLSTTTFSTPEYGPLHVQILTVAYAALLYGIVIASSGKDYLHLTKAFGHVAVSQLPMLYFLSIKSPSLVYALTSLTGLTHERLNVYHRMLGRAVHLLLAAHASLYLNFFLAKNLMEKRMKDLDVQTGLAAFTAVNLLGLSALPGVRARWYFQVFYRTHVLVSASLVGLLWLHVPYTRIYVAQAGILWIASGVLRRSAWWSDEVDVVCVTDDSGDGRGTVEVTARIRRKESMRRWLDNYLPGMHGYLNQSGLGPKAPFTVVSVDKNIAGGDEWVDVKMMAKNLGGPTTSLLSKAAKSEKSLNLTLEGPYGQAKEYMPGLLEAGKEAGKTLLVAGGVGATYALPIYTELLKARKFETTEIKLVWIVQEATDALWGLKILSRLGSNVDVDLIITRDGGKTSKSIITKYEQSLKGLVVDLEGGRPDLTKVVNGFMGINTNDLNRTTTVMVCGPFTLSQHLKSVVGKSVMNHGRRVDWYEEQFGFGGS